MQKVKLNKQCSKRKKYFLSTKIITVDRRLADILVEDEETKKMVRPVITLGFDNFSRIIFADIEFYDS